MTAKTIHTIVSLCAIALVACGGAAHAPAETEPVDAPQSPTIAPQLSDAQSDAEPLRGQRGADMGDPEPEPVEVETPAEADPAQPDPAQSDPVIDEPAADMEPEPEPVECTAYVPPRDEPLSDDDVERGVCFATEVIPCTHDRDCTQCNADREITSPWVCMRIACETVDDCEGIEGYNGMHGSEVECLPRSTDPDGPHACHVPQAGYNGECIDDDDCEPGLRCSRSRYLCIAEL